jgi:SNF2 family DNA or RNA helicase
MCEILIKEFEAMGLKYLYIWGGTDQKRRADMQKEFNEDQKIDVIIGTDAMSCGLNLTGADYVINYDDFWSPSIMAQREDRSHRIGQKNVVTVINFICRDTIEERIRDVLYNKSRVTAETLGDNTEEFVLRRLNPRELAKLL